MPSPKRKRSKRKSTSVSTSLSSVKHVVFLPLLFLTFIVWVIYRSLFNFPVWFDETIGKAVFFGFPVWLYVSIGRSFVIPDTFSLTKFKPGLLLGLAFGGIFGFGAALASLVGGHSQVLAVSLFSSDLFWWEFFLAMMTGFWETLFFYSFVMTVIQATWSKWSLLQQVLLTALIFLIFHIPNVILQFDGPVVISQVVLLFLFAVGQAFIYARSHNAYALVISHAIWGMALLVHVR